VDINQWQSPVRKGTTIGNQWQSRGNQWQLRGNQWQSPVRKGTTIGALGPR